MNTYKRQRTQSGAVSLFIVIFAALLMTVVTISFIQLMIKDQQQATTSDLSQSAYDSAQAGVEDAKRLLLLNQSCVNNTAASTVNCAAVAAALTPAPGSNETGCDTLAKGLQIGDPDGETIIQQSSSNDSKLDQAYTCVKIGVDTDDFTGQVLVNQTTLVPLRGVSDFDTIELSWFSKDDVPTSGTDPAVGFPSNGTNVNLPPVGDSWKANYPALLRTQFMQTGDSFKLSDFDDGQAGKSNANTLFLYPTETGATSTSFALDGRRSPTNAPQPTHCENSFTNAEYVCTTTITLPTPIDSSANRNPFLRLSGLYNGAHFKVSLKKGGANGTPVAFNGVQPIVDSTGRANDLFRRVQARVELTSDMTYPDAVIDLDGDLCKNFTITNDDSGYSNSATCTP
jgi:Tfp pilus assembly protein PilX